MFKSIDPSDIYNKNINILIGSGASADLFPTLALQVTDSQGKRQTIETLATTYADNLALKTTIFMHYFSQCIFPVQNFNPENISSKDGQENLANYEALIKTLLGLLERRNDMNKKVNLFTTNYDGCLAFSADKIQEKGGYGFVVNDGTSGFRRKHLHARNFNTLQYRTGVFERANYGIPQLNIIHLHGSVYWRKDGEQIEVDYDREAKDILSQSTRLKLTPFSEYITSVGSTTTGMPEVALLASQRDAFWNHYNQLPIVNPTKWKFHETVFEEHYYQMLRLLSYELEKPNSILITFGFSFADEHILRLVQRSLSNPTLKVYVCSYSQGGASALQREFKAFQNVDVISLSGDDKLNFSNFNKFVFSLKPDKYIEPGIEDLV